MVQWLTFCLPVQGVCVPPLSWPKRKKKTKTPKQKQYFNKFNKDFKNGPHQKKKKKDKKRGIMTDTLTMFRREQRK